MSIRGAVAVLVLGAALMAGLMNYAGATAGSSDGQASEYCQYGSGQYGQCSPPSSGCEYGSDQYGNDQYGNDQYAQCLPPPNCQYEVGQYGQCEPPDYSTPPQLWALAVSPTAIETASGPATVTVTATITTNASGFAGAYISFVSPSGTHHRGGGTPDTGDDQFTAIGGNQYRARITFPRYSEPGVWHVWDISFGDRAGNSRFLDGSTDLQSMGIDPTVTVTGIEDDTPPVVSALDVSPGTVEVTPGPAAVTVTATVIDDLSGFGSGWVELSSPSGVGSSWAQLSPAGGDRYSATITIAQGADPGVWHVDRLELSDKAGNYVDLQRSDLQALGLDPALTVTRTTDSTPPQLTALSVTPDAVDTTSAPATVTITATITDDLSGFSYGYMSLASPGGLYLSASAFTAIGGDRYTATVVIPRYAQPGTWHVDSISLTDHSWNTRWLGRWDLQDLGIDASVEVTGIQDVTAPVITAMTVSPATIDITSSSVNVTLTATITDDLSGFSSGSLTFTSPSGAQMISQGIFATSTGSDQYTATLYFPRWSETGDWHIQSVSVADGVSNWRWLDRMGLQALGIDPVITVTGAGDTSAPSLSSLTVSPTTVDVTSGSATATVTATITDDLSGFAWGSLYFMGPDGMQNTWSGSFSYLDGDRYRATVTFPSGAEPGVWHVYYVSLTDNVRNTATLSRSDLQPLGIDPVVTVENRGAPVLTVPGDLTVEATSMWGTAVSYDVSVADNDDPSPSVSCWPPRGSWLGLGDTTVNCNASDASGNRAFASFVVHVVDTTPPVIAAHPDIRVPITDAAATAAVVTYEPPEVTDAVDPTSAATCSPASGSSFPLGHTTVTCSATDAAGNHAAGTTFDVFVGDLLPPVIAYHGNVHLAIHDPHAVSASVTYASPAVHDDIDAAHPASCAPVSGSTFPLGTTTVTCTAVDRAGNAAADTQFLVFVAYVPAATGTSPVTITSFTDPGITQPRQIVAGPDGAMWFTNWGPSAVGRISTDGDTTVVSSYRDPAISSPFGITAGPDGAVWFTSGTIARITPDGAVSGFQTYSSPLDIVAGPDGALWWADPWNGIGRTTTSGETTRQWVNGATRLAFGPDGSLWFVTQWNQIGRIAPDGAVTYYVDSRLNAPWSITAGPDGAMWFTNLANGSIGRIATDGTMTFYSSSDVQGPVDITTGPDGALWFTNWNSIGRIDVHGKTSSYHDPSISQPESITTGPDGALWFTNNGNGSIGRIELHPDTTPPVIAPHADVHSVIHDAKATSTAVTYTAPQVTDNVDAPAQATCSPASGSPFPLGHSKVTCSATDAAGNHATDTHFDVWVEFVDTTAPVIKPHDDVHVVTHDAKATAVAVPYTQPLATDDFDPTFAATCSPAPGAAFPLGHTTVTCSAADAAGNRATPAHFDVWVEFVDNTPPVLRLPDDIFVDANSPAGAAVSFKVTTDDDSDPSPYLTCTRTSGTVFPVGYTQVYCKAIDRAGNRVEGSFGIQVRGAADQLANLRAVVAGAGLDRPLAAYFGDRLATATQKLNQPAKACNQLAQLTTRVFTELGKDKTSLTTPTADQLLSATTVEQALGCLPPDWPFAPAEHHTVALIAAIDGLGTPPWVQNLRAKASELGTQLVNGDRAAAAQTLGGIDGKVRDLTGKPGKLTTAQAAQLHTLVAAVGADLGL